MRTPTGVLSPKAAATDHAAICPEDYTAAHGRMRTEQVTTRLGPFGGGDQSSLLASSRRQAGTPLPQQRYVEKPWGWEIVWAETEAYVGKLLHVRAGERLSLQYHDRKLETQSLLCGRAILVLEEARGMLREIAMEPGKGYTILPYQRHRLVGLTDADVVEVSTPEIGTTFRIEDDYARSDEAVLRRGI
jgi:mannose-6-phosphate isomerase